MTQTIVLTDPQIRSALKSYILASRQGEEHAIIGELGLRRRLARADLAVVADLLHGYEIKSDKDTLRRLEWQVTLYGEIFDRATIVVGITHLEKIQNLVPPWWEILLATGDASGVHIRQVRPGSLNPGRLARSLVEFLWRDASLKLLEEHDGISGYRSRPRKDLWDRICQLCSLDDISVAVRNHLRARPMPESVVTSA